MLFNSFFICLKDLKYEVVMTQKARFVNVLLPNIVTKCFVMFSVAQNGKDPGEDVEVNPH